MNLGWETVHRQRSRHFQNTSRGTAGARKLAWLGRAAEDLLYVLSDGGGRANEEQRGAQRTDYNLATNLSLLFVYIFNLCVWTCVWGCQEVGTSARLAGQWVSGSFLSLFPQCGDYKYIATASGSYTLGAWGTNPGPHAWMESTLLRSHLRRPTFTL